MKPIEDENEHGKSFRKLKKKLVKQKKEEEEGNEKYGKIVKRKNNFNSIFEL